MSCLLSPGLPSVSWTVPSVGRQGTCTLLEALSPREPPRTQPRYRAVMTGHVRARPVSPVWLDGAALAKADLRFHSEL